MSTSKTNVQTAVRCVHRDMISGVVEPLPAHVTSASWLAEIERTPGEIVRTSTASRVAAGFVLTAQDGSTYYAATLADAERIAAALGLDARRPAPLNSRVVSYVDTSIVRHDRPESTTSERAVELADRRAPRERENDMPAKSTAPKTVAERKSAETKAAVADTKRRSTAAAAAAEDVANLVDKLVDELHDDPTIDDDMIGPFVERLTNESIAAMNPTERRKLLLSESAAKRAALAANEPVPPMPVTEWTTRSDATQRQQQPTSSTSSKRTSTSSTKTPKSKLQFTKNGKPVSSVSLSAVAYDFTSSIAALSSASSKRLTTSEFRAWLVVQGISDPDSSAWSVKLPNGDVLAAVLADQPTPAEPVVEPKPAAAKPAAKTSKRPSTLPAANRQRAAKKAAATRAAKRSAKAS